MKFTVQFLDDSKLTQLGSVDEGFNFNRTFKYDLNKNQDLFTHLTNIHKSLNTLGFSITDSVTLFSLRIRPLGATTADFPMYLEDENLEAQLVRFVELAKPFKRKGYLLEFILSPEVRAKRFIQKITNQSTSAIKLKEIVFVLASQLQEKCVAEKFFLHGGVTNLFAILDVAKGNMLSYAIAAISAVLKHISIGEVLGGNSGGVSKLLQLLQGSVLSVCRRAMEVLEEICVNKEGCEIFKRAATADDNKGYATIFSRLESEDLHTRLGGLRIINKVLEYSEEKAQLLELFQQHNVLLRLQKSLWIKTPDMVQALSLFERRSGITLTQHTGAESRKDDAQLKQRVLQLEEELKTFQTQTNRKDEIEVDLLDSLEGELNDLSIDYDEIASEMRLSSGMSHSQRSSSNNSDEMFSLEEAYSNSPTENKKNFVDRMKHFSMRKGSLPASVELQDTLDEKNTEVQALRKELEQTRKQNEELQSKVDSLCATIKSYIIDDPEFRSGESGQRIESRIFYQADKDLNMDEVIRKHARPSQRIRDSTVVHALCLEVNARDSIINAQNQPSLLTAKFNLSTPHSLTTGLSSDRKQQQQQQQNPMVMKNRQIRSILPEANSATTSAARSAILELEKEKVMLESCISDLREQNSSLEVDKYQTSIELDRLSKEIPLIKQKKRKLFQVCSNLEQKRATLQSDCENMRQQNEQLKQKMQKLLLETSEIQPTKEAIHVTLQEKEKAENDTPSTEYATSLTKPELEKKLYFMEKLLLSTLADNYNYKQVLSEHSPNSSS